MAMETMPEIVTAASGTYYAWHRMPQLKEPRKYASGTSLAKNKKVGCVDCFVLLAVVVLLACRLFVLKFDFIILVVA